MRTLVSNSTVRQWQEEPGGNVHTGQQSAPLYQEENGLTLMHARFGPEAMTPIHNHNSWGIIGVYKGRDRYQIWRRLDAGSGHGKAQVELVEERILELQARKGTLAAATLDGEGEAAPVLGAEDIEHLFGVG